MLRSFTLSFKIVPMSNQLESLPVTTPQSSVDSLPQITGREALLVAIGTIVVLGFQTLLAGPQILFFRYLQLDEQSTKLIASAPDLRSSIVTLENSGDPTPPLYHILARASWGIARGSGEGAFRGLSLVATVIALLATYAVLRRSFATLPTIVAILALWSCPLVIHSAFYARPYALLLAATAGFSFVYGIEDLRPAGLVLLATLSVMVCTVHYFGCLGLTAIVLGELLTSRTKLRSQHRRLLAVLAGPVALVACLPLMGAQIEGFSHLGYSGPLTTDYGVSTVVELLGVPMLIASGLVVAWWISELGLSRGSVQKIVGAHDQVVRLQPVAGLSALLLVPLMVIALSPLARNLVVASEMIAGLLGSTALIAMLGCRLSTRMLTVAAVALVLMSGWNARVVSTDLSALQAGEEIMLKQRAALTDKGLPIVTFNHPAAFATSEHAPRSDSLPFSVSL
jgi:hypothetical protein